MKFYCLMSLDLNHVTGTQRDTFDEYLKSKKWTKLAKVGTVWKCQFEPSVSEADAKQIVAADIRNGAAKASIGELHADLMLSTSPVFAANVP